MRDSRRVVDIQVMGAQLPYRKGYRWAFNEYVGPCVLLVRLEDAGGIVGWGELPISYHPVIPGEAVALMVGALAQRLVADRLPAPRQFVAEASSLTGWLWYRHMGASVMSGIELGLWDLLARQQESHVSSLLGGRVRDAMECMWFVFDGTPEEMDQATKVGVERGFRIYYVKWYGSDQDMFDKLEAVRQSLPSDGLLRVDPNETWTRASALRRLKIFEDWPVEFVEQPLPRFDRDGIRDIRQRTSVTINSDQGTRLIEEVLDAIRCGTMDTLTVSPSDAGGLARALDICALTRAAGIPVGMHSNNELGVGLASMVTVACLSENCTYASQTEYPQLEWDVTHGLNFDGPWLAPNWSGPGWGVEIDLEALVKARANYEQGQANQSPLEAPGHERHFIPGY
jgi:L-alanine-DL-glutamate epimerase-like enolase superfamily enzyme